MKDPALYELDLAIPDMLSEAEEAQAGEALRQLPGVEAVRLVSRGAWVSYRASVISKEEICQTLRQLGFRASTFQDSKTGKTGEFSA